MAFLCAFIFFCDTFLFELLSAFILGTIDRVAVCVWNLFCLEFCLSILNIFCKFTAKNDVCHALYIVQREIYYIKTIAHRLLFNQQHKKPTTTSGRANSKKNTANFFRSRSATLAEYKNVSEYLSKCPKRMRNMHLKRIVNEYGATNNTHTHSHTQAKRIVLWVEQLLNFILVLFTYFQFQFLLLICDIQRRVPSRLEASVVCLSSCQMATTNI